MPIDDIGSSQPLPHTSVSDDELMRLQAGALFVHDANGRLLRVNEPESTSPAPRFFLGRTAAGNLWRTRFDLPAELAAELARLAADELVSADLHAPPKHEADYRELLGRHAPVSSVFAGPAYWLPETTLPPNVVMLTPDNLPVVDANFRWLRAEMDGCAPVALVVLDGAAVAACFSSRITAQVCEAGVFTVEAFRGRGCAADVVRGWAAAVRATDRLALYSTSWENRASQAVASKLGAVPYGSDYSVT